jgi:hypothetical protein
MLFLKRPKLFNENLHNYCLQSTNNYIKKLVGKIDEERKFPKCKIDLVTENYVSDPNSNPNNFIFSVLVFLSTTSILYYFYNSKK